MAIVDWRNVPTWTEFEILRDAFITAGVPTIVCDPRELAFDARRPARSRGGASTSSTGACSSTTSSRGRTTAPRSCDAYAAGAVCVANTLRCKLAHKKAFFAVLTDPRNARLFSDEEHAVIRACVPWTRVVADCSTEKDGRAIDLLKRVESDRERLVLKPNDEYGGKGVAARLGNDRRPNGQAR